MTIGNDNNSVTCHRHGEDNVRVTSRSDRLFTVGPDWYFCTREGIEKGPFENKKYAENAINTYLREIAFKLICEDVPSDKA